MAKYKTEAARAAAMIRKHLKANGVDAKVRSKTYSMGSSVDVDLENPLPATREKVTSYCAQYQMGHFDGMIDLYEYSNRQDDIPQAKHVFVNACYSDELKQACWDYLRGMLAKLEHAPEVYKASNYGEPHYDAGCNFCTEFGDRGSELVYRELRSNDFGFWSDRKPRVRAA